MRKIFYSVLMGAGMALALNVACAATETAMPKIVKHGSGTGSVYFTSSLRYAVIYGAGAGTTVYDLTTGLLLQEFGNAESVAISPDDRFLVMTSDGATEIYDLFKGTGFASYALGGNRAAFSRDGRWLTVASLDAIFQLPFPLPNQTTMRSAAEVRAAGGRWAGNSGFTFPSKLDNGRLNEGSLSQSADGRHVLLTAWWGSNGQTWSLADMEPGQLRVQLFPYDRRCGWKDYLSGAVTPDGARVLADTQCVAGDQPLPPTDFELSGMPKEHVFELRDFRHPEQRLARSNPVNLTYIEQNIWNGGVIRFQDNTHALVERQGQYGGHYRVDLDAFQKVAPSASLAGGVMDEMGRYSMSLMDNQETGSRHEPLLALYDMDGFAIRTVDKPKFNDGKLDAAANGIYLTQAWRGGFRITNLTSGIAVFEKQTRGTSDQSKYFEAAVAPSGDWAYYETEPEPVWDGKEWEAQEGQTRIRILDMDVATARERPKDLPSLGYGGKFSSRGSYLLVGSKKEEGKLLTEAALISKRGEVVGKIQNLPYDISGCSFSEDERRLFCVNGDIRGEAVRATVYSIPDGKPIRDLSSQLAAAYERDPGHVKMSPDGRWIYYKPDHRYDDPHFLCNHIISVDGGEEVYQGEQASTELAVWTRDNRLVERDDRHKSVTVYDPSAKTRQTLPFQDCDFPALPGNGLVFCFNFGLGNKSQLAVYDEKTGAPRNRLEGSFDTRSLILTPDRKRLVVTGGRSRYLLDTATGELLGELLVSKDDWVMTLPGGFYSKPRGANRLISLVKNGHAYPVEQFDLTMNRPDLMRERLGAPQSLVNATRRAYQKRLQKQGAVDEAKRPAIEIERGGLALVTPDSTVNLPYRAAPLQGRKISRVQVYVNGVPALGKAGQPLPADDPAARRTVPVALTAGSNHIEVSVYDDAGVESLRDGVFVTSKRPALPVTRYVLAVGVSKYRDENLNLDYAAKDAGDIAAALSGKTEGIARTVVKTLLDGEVTRDNLREARKFFAEAAPQDQAIIFIAGHGLLDEKDDYYFAAHDIEATAPSAKGVPMSDIEDLFSETRARGRLLLIDTCHSGEVDHDMEQKLAQLPKGVAGTRALKLKSSSNAVGKESSADTTQDVAYVSELFADFSRGVGATVLASASGIELAQESAQYKNGLFTSVLLAALRDRRTDADDSHTVELVELRDRVAAQVRALSNGTQNPSTRAENYDENLRMADWSGKQTSRPVEKKSKTRKTK